MPSYDPISLRIACPPSEYSTEFLQGMLNRMAISYHKYGEVELGFPDRISALDSLQQRIAKYLETGNTEYLIDAANFAMIEFMRPSLSQAAFTPTDSDGSPGRIARGTGGTVYDRNSEL